MSTVQFGKQGCRTNKKGNSESHHKKSLKKVSIRLISLFSDMPELKVKTMYIFQKISLLFAL